MLPELLLLASLSASNQADLVAAAAASGRPSECVAPKKNKLAGKNSIWKRARSPRLRRYCHLLSRAHARLSYDAVGAKAAALDADKTLPGHAAPHVVLARVAMQKKELDEARQQFERALALDPRAVEQPVAMHDLALLRWRSGQLDKALETYRALVPRVNLLPTRTARATALLEAAHVSMAAAAKGAGASQLHEPLAFLREAVRDQNHRYRTDIALSLVLALDRAGYTAQSDALLTELRELKLWTSKPPGPYLAAGDDYHALRALALESFDTQAAAAEWRRYLASSTVASAWKQAAQNRLNRLKRPTVRRRGRRPR